jgi:hypothetical protein
MTWIYKQKELTQIPDGVFGFVYQITNLACDPIRYYIGKKFFYKSSSRQINKKKKKIKIESDWIDYYGSSKEVQAEVEKYGKSFFTREILHLCQNKAECSAYETLEILSRNALLDATYYNDWISCRITKVQLKAIYKWLPPASIKEIPLQ